MDAKKFAIVIDTKIGQYRKKLAYSIYNVHLLYIVLCLFKIKTRTVSSEYSCKAILICTGIGDFTPRKIGCPAYRKIPSSKQGQEL